MRRSPNHPKPTPSHPLRPRSQAEPTAHRAQLQPHRIEVVAATAAHHLAGRQRPRRRVKHLRHGERSSQAGTLGAEKAEPLADAPKPNADGRVRDASGRFVPADKTEKPEGEVAAKAVEPKPVEAKAPEAVAEKPADTALHPHANWSDVYK